MSKARDYLTEQFSVTFQQQPDFMLSCGGRFEVLGNHTDHNHGLCMAATCNLNIYGAFKKREDNEIHLLSEGFGFSNIDLSTLDKDDDEVGKPVSLIRGIAKYFTDLNYEFKGLDIYIASRIPSGVGVSSSAAFELLIAQAFNVAFNNKKIPLMDLCKAGQYAEKNYYGKMCGLQDQIGVSHGGLTAIDFNDVINPKVKNLHINLDGYQFIIVDTGGSHAELSDLYKSIPDDMYNVANVFGKQYLRDEDVDQVKENKASVIEKCGKKAYQRSVHFYDENERVEKALKALERDDIERLIKLINQSRESSTELLENMCVDGKVKGSPLEACKLVMKASHDKAGVKINGGGFAGAVIALVPESELDNVVKAAKEKYGKDNVYATSIRNEIPSEIE